MDLCFEEVFESMAQAATFVIRILRISQCHKFGIPPKEFGECPKIQFGDLERVLPTIESLTRKMLL